LPPRTWFFLFCRETSKTVFASSTVQPFQPEASCFRAEPKRSRQCGACFAGSAGWEGWVGWSWEQVAVLPDVAFGSDRLRVWRAGQAALGAAGLVLLYLATSVASFWYPPVRSKSRISVSLMSLRVRVIRLQPAGRNRRSSSEVRYCLAESFSLLERWSRVCVQGDSVRSVG